MDLSSLAVALPFPAEPSPAAGENLHPQLPLELLRLILDDTITQLFADFGWQSAAELLLLYSALLSSSRRPLLSIDLAWRARLGSSPIQNSRGERVPCRLRRNCQCWGGNRDVRLAESTAAEGGPPDLSKCSGGEGVARLRSAIVRHLASLRGREEAPADHATEVGCLSGQGCPRFTIGESYWASDEPQTSGTCRHRPRRPRWTPSEPTDLSTCLPFTRILLPRPPNSTQLSPLSLPPHAEAPRCSSHFSSAGWRPVLLAHHLRPHPWDTSAQ